MRIAHCRLESVTLYQQRRPLSLAEFPKNSGEGNDEYEQRAWKETAHWNADGQLYIPGMAIKKAIEARAQSDPLKIPGQRNALYTKFFKSSVSAMGHIVLPVTRETVESDIRFVKIPNGTGSVYKTFPTVPHWEGEISFLLAENRLIPEVFERYLSGAGIHIGIGVWRPQSGGMNGRFMVKNVTWEENIAEDSMLTLLAGRRTGLIVEPGKKAVKKTNGTAQQVEA